MMVRSVQPGRRGTFPAEFGQTMNAPIQPAARWPKRIGRIALTLLAIVMLGLAGVGLFLALVVVGSAWDGGMGVMFVWMIPLIGVPLLALQFVLSLVLFLLRKRLAPLRFALVASALAMVLLLGAQTGLVALTVHNDRLAAAVRAEDEATLADLEQAVQAGDVARARRLLGDLRVAALFNGRPAAEALSGAADRKDRAMLETLLAKCPSLPCTASVHGEPGPLHHAAAGGDVEIARLLVDKGFKVNAGDADYKTPLAWANEHGRTEMAAFLATRGAVPEDRVSRALDAAAQGDGATVRRLVDEGLDPNTSQAWGKTLLHYAAGAGDTQTAELLLTKGADLAARNHAGETPLDVAARRNQAEMVQLLCRPGRAPAP